MTGAIPTIKKFAEEMKKFTQGGVRNEFWSYYDIKGEEESGKSSQCNAASDCGEGNHLPQLRSNIGVCPR